MFLGLTKLDFKFFTEQARTHFLPFPRSISAIICEFAISLNVCFELGQGITDLLAIDCIERKETHLLCEGVRSIKVLATCRMRTRRKFDLLSDLTWHLRSIPYDLWFPRCLPHDAMVASRSHPERSICRHEFASVPVKLLPDPEIF
jgi:hypothetical protein